MKLHKSLTDARRLRHENVNRQLYELELELVSLANDAGDPVRRESVSEVAWTVNRARRLLNTVLQRDNVLRDHETGEQR